jgi:hypothetical protein
MTGDLFWNVTCGVQDTRRRVKRYRFTAGH